MYRDRGNFHPKSIYEWLAHIQPRIDCYLRQPAADALQDYLHGYLAALSLNCILEAEAPPFGLFHHWLGYRLPGSAPAYGWAYMLTTREGSPEAALERFFELAAEYGSLKPALAARRVIPPGFSATDAYRRANPAHGVPTSLEIYHLQPSRFHFVRYWWGEWPEDSSLHTSLEHAWDQVSWHLGHEIVHWAQ